MKTTRPAVICAHSERMLSGPKMAKSSSFSTWTRRRSRMSMRTSSVTSDLFFELSYLMEMMVSRISGWILWKVLMGKTALLSLGLLPPPNSCLNLSRTPMTVKTSPSMTNFFPDGILPVEELLSSVVAQDDDVGARETPRLR